MDDRRKVLILGGTREARELALMLSADPRFSVVTSLAGATNQPAEISGEVRRGGFGGVDGLVDYLRMNRVKILVDATHPFAGNISQNAAEACKGADVERLTVLRPPWLPVLGDRWIKVSDVSEAANCLSEIGSRIFLTIGRQEIKAFEVCRDNWFLIRTIDPPEKPFALPSCEVLLARGPFEVDAEMRLFSSYGIEGVVAKNSGGSDTYAKIEAARAMNLPVVIIDRPPAPSGLTVADAEAAYQQIA